MIGVNLKMRSKSQALSATRRRERRLAARPIHLRAQGQPLRQPVREMLKHQLRPPQQALQLKVLRKDKTPERQTRAKDRELQVAQAILHLPVPFGPQALMEDQFQCPMGLFLTIQAIRNMANTNLKGENCGVSFTMGESPQNNISKK